MCIVSVYMGICIWLEPNWLIASKEFEDSKSHVLHQLQNFIYILPLSGYDNAPMRNVVVLKWRMKYLCRSKKAWISYNRLTVPTEYKCQITQIMLFFINLHQLDFDYRLHYTCTLICIWIPHDQLPYVLIFHKYICIQQVKT